MAQLKSLRQASTVLFLGAGASAFAGYQTFRGFGDLILNDLIRFKEGLPVIAPETPRLISELNEALRRMRRPATHDQYLWLLTEYQNFCEKFDVHTGLQDRFPRISDEVHAFGGVATAAIGDVTKTTFSHYSRQRDTGAVGEEIRSLYEELAARNDHTEPFLPIYTTNYDLLIEDLFADPQKTEHSIPLCNGIPGRTRRGAKWTPSAYQTAGVHLYRLHGCVGWFNEPQNKGGTEVVFQRPDQISGDLLNRLCVMFPGHEKERGKDPHGFGFRLLYSSLLTCRTVVFIGFSFRDDDVMQILLAANAARERPLRILMIDPRVGEQEALGNFGGAASRSAFHVRLPQTADMTWLRMNFGVPGLKNTMMDYIKCEGI